MSDGWRFGLLQGLMTGLAIGGQVGKEAAMGMAVFTVLCILFLWLVVQPTKKQ
jgi:hypothetical protein